jgi:coenzyme F420-0:L-glutamate ligase/coenzyme F420-1:gamma-L-glutamate ligase
MALERREGTAWRAHLGGCAPPLRALSIYPLHGLGEINPGDDLAQLLGATLDAQALRPNAYDVLIIAQKAVSKAENRYVELETVRVSREAERLAKVTSKDARLVTLILSESSVVLRAKPGVLIVRHRLGYVMANAGIDRSNLSGGADRVLLLPEDPDGSAARLRGDLGARWGVAPAVVISDSFGRPWRKGVTNVALGAAGLPALIDRRGEMDRNGRRLEVTEVAFADLIASAAGLLMGEGAESIPAVLVRGLAWSAPVQPAGALVRPSQEDLFR